jgi:hypothetical protein
MNTQPTTLADLIAAGEIDPRRPYEPGGVGQGIDREVAEKYPCVRCGARCTYQGFKRDDGAYIALQVCSECRHVEPF